MTIPGPPLVGAASLWTGACPGARNSVTICRRPAAIKLRTGARRPNTRYDVNKPCVFTVDGGHKVMHEQW